MMFLDLPLNRVIHIKDYYSAEDKIIRHKVWLESRPDLPVHPPPRFSPYILTIPIIWPDSHPGHVQDKTRQITKPKTAN